MRRRRRRRKGRTGVRWDRRGKYESVEGMEEEIEMGERNQLKAFRQITALKLISHMSVIKFSKKFELISMAVSHDFI